MKDTIESLLAEEQELEKLMAGPPTDGDTKSDEATKQQAEQKEAPTEKKELVAPDSKSAPDEQQAVQTGEDWEYRYKQLRASRDSKSMTLKNELSTALETISNLQSEITKLRTAAPKVDPLEGVFTAEDTESLGDATIDAMRRATAKATEAATKPLQDQLEAERAERIKGQGPRAKELKQEAYNTFLSRIAGSVPDWEEVNYDPAFVQWMDGPDMDGTPRKTYFAQAEAQHNSALIIRYMLEYKGTKPPEKEDKLAKKVTPTGEGAGATQAKEPAEPEKISRAFIDKFYDDLNRGRYQGRHSEAQAIEARIDKATMEGNIV